MCLKSILGCKYKASCDNLQQKSENKISFSLSNTLKCSIKAEFMA